MSGRILGGKAITVALPEAEQQPGAAPAAEQPMGPSPSGLPPTFKLHVKGMPSDATAATLADLFR